MRACRASQQNSFEKNLGSVQTRHWLRETPVSNMQRRANIELVAGNDILMFDTGKNRGVIVANAKPELLHFHQDHTSEDHRILLSAHSFADGVVDGISRLMEYE